ncbi:hypothetical protein [Sulfurospirillum deleyianum]|uniref:Uncharacterized protein n=1 Tax=Sulfurospirillum deleyianum (strain ATCC 51133 / DSM 6946 / 5175) TaxID=525898 RepID=D1B4R3_SULD5|nr:hypothetical protein [Sulfurospirillum deleyianum]ACZ13083.1 hypothetical protein Sdel_2071 [Sulfurospirillum deleyianum DSM 6946]
MLKALNEDAIQTGVSHHVQTHQSDWGTLALTTQYDIVIASMTPAINNVQKIEKILGASKQLGIYVGWEKYRTNKLVEASVKAHTLKEEEYSFEEAKEYAYEQLGRKELTPNDTIIESILIKHMQNDQVIVKTQAEKGVVLWKAT